ncbi:MAG TPA: hypothetical protein VMW08_00490 [Acidimicrobiales bacterium]|nr:hypothetical protein [Acidimicrobiales bacterium]
MADWPTFQEAAEAERQRHQAAQRMAHAAYVGLRQVRPALEAFADAVKGVGVAFAEFAEKMKAVSDAGDEAPE